MSKDILDEPVRLLKRALKAMSRSGWEEGENDSDVSDAISEYLMWHSLESKGESGGDITERGHMTDQKPKMSHWLKPVTRGFPFFPLILPLDTRLHCQLGAIFVTKNNRIQYEQPRKPPPGGSVELLFVEETAEAENNPNDDWRVRWFLPIGEIQYQRQGLNNWVMVKNGMGFE